MKKEELEKKSWYRFLKVIFYGVSIVVLIITFFAAKESAENQILDEDRTFEVIGETVKITNTPWDTWKYPELNTLSNKEIGKIFYENRYSDRNFSNAWLNKKGTYEFYKDQHNSYQKFNLYLKYFGLVLFALITMRAIGLYIVAGKKIK